MTVVRLDINSGEDLENARAMLKDRLQRGPFALLFGADDEILKYDISDIMAKRKIDELASFKESVAERIQREKELKAEKAGHDEASGK